MKNNLVSLFAFAIMICLFACSKETEPSPITSVKLEGSTWTRLDHDSEGGLVYQVFEFKANGRGRTDYRLNKTVLAVPITEFTYRYNQESVWVTVDKGKSDKYAQEGRFIEGRIVFGNHMYYRE